MTARQAPGPLLGPDLLERGASLALAVSGGGDSIAMLHLIAAWARQTGASVQIFTVDHRLRAESADEAAFVAETCRALALPHQTLVWTSPHPSQASARAARHRLLAEAARTVGASYLLLGHTIDDVEETQAMRARRGTQTELQTGPMPVSVSPVWPDGRGLLLLRPLLLMRRQALRDWLRAASLTWVDDPSNLNAAYERPRIRQALAAGPSSDAAATHHALIARAQTEAALIPLLRQCAATCDPYGLIRIPISTDPARMRALLSILIPAASGQDRQPKADARQRAIDALFDPQTTRHTLGGAWLQRSGEDILIGRDPADVPSAQTGPLFDGRFVHDTAAALPIEPPAPFLLRHALPDGRHWRSLIPDRLLTHAKALAFNAALLTTPRGANPS